MSEKFFHALEDLTPGTFDWNVKVRIIRSWRGVSNKGEEFKGLNVLLLDDKNYRIHAFVPGNIIQAHEDNLYEGNLCEISNFSVKNYKQEDKFRCVANNKQIIFTNYTKIQQINGEDSMIEKNMFDFYDMQDLGNIANDNLYLTDIIGVIEKDMPLTNLVNRFGKQQKQVKFTIVDGRCSINVTFWDALAEEFTIALTEVKEFPTIIIIASAKITSWTGTHHSTPQTEISNVTATKFYLNLDDYNVFNLRKMLSEVMFSKYDFVSHVKEEIEILTVCEIKNLTPEYAEKEVICKVKISSVVETDNWFQYTCTSCYLIQGVCGALKCYRCGNRNVPYPEKKWTVSVVGQDNSGEVDIVLMDQEVKTIFQLSVQDFQNQEKNNNVFPRFLATLVNKWYTVKLYIKKGNIDKQLESYQSTGIFEHFEENIDRTEIDNTEDSCQMKGSNSQMQSSVSQSSAKTCHLDDFSDLNFNSPDIKKKRKKKTRKIS